MSYYMPLQPASPEALAASHAHLQSLLALQRGGKSERFVFESFDKCPNYIDPSWASCDPAAGTSALAIPSSFSENATSSTIVAHRGDTVIYTPAAGRSPGPAGSGRSASPLPTRMRCRRCNRGRWSRPVPRSKTGSHSARCAMKISMPMPGISFCSGWCSTWVSTMPSLLLRGWAATFHSPPILVVQPQQKPPSSPL